MSCNMNDIIIDFKSTGVNTVDDNKVLNKWNHLWRISQWNDEYTLLKYKRKDSDILILKTKISEIQAKLFIEKLSLINQQSPVFHSGSTWLREKDCK